MRRRRRRLEMSTTSTDATGSVVMLAQRGLFSGSQCRHVKTADLDDSMSVAWTRVAEALRYRPLDARSAETVAANTAMVAVT
jgi:hypothetical protein